jgi:glycosyltransferase involved in cell wall biosynthesis
LLIPLQVNRDSRIPKGFAEYPRIDYFEIAQRVDAAIVDNATIGDHSDALDRLVRRWLGLAPAHALWAYRHRAQFDLFYSDAERVGLPLAATLQSVATPPRHVMIGHWLSPMKKRAPLQYGRLHARIDRIICHIPTQARVAEQAGVPRSKVSVVPYGVDQEFWRPLPVPEDDYICTAGREGRDYTTFLSAVGRTDIRVVAAAASAWSNSVGVNRADPVPTNVSFGKFNYVDLRELYARSRFVVVPLIDLDFQAGITTILEAMACGKAVIVSRTRGQADAGVVQHGVNGLFVTPGNADELTNAINYLWNHPDEARRLGEAGRRAVTDRFNLDAFAGDVATTITALL